MIIDTHCHIYLDEFDEDRSEMILRAENEGVSHFLLPAIDSSSHKKMLNVIDEFPGKCMGMIGLHPCSVKENYKEELLIVENYLESTDFIAIGEIGLDFYWDKTFSDLQYEAFRKQIDLAQENNLPIVIQL